ncbi:MAG: M15 family metallopeptidase [Clostridiales bacterium]|nr:M15 family metallopeptidase [Clostridiales bacterium]
MLEKLISLVLLSGTLFSNVLYNTVPQKKIDGEIFLVNREFVISESYVPDLVNTQVQGSLRLQREDAAKGLEDMFAAAKEEEGIKLVTVSGYRSYAKQERIYDNKLKKVKTEEKADEYVANAGTSEHQLGLAMDLGEKDVHTSLTAGFAKTKAGIWLVDNAHRFGFIIRYQEPWEEITGYKYEPWHVRYVGIEHATAMYEKEIPMEYYVQQMQMEQLKMWLTFDEEDTAQEQNTISIIP